MNDDLDKKLSLITEKLAAKLPSSKNKDNMIKWLNSSKYSPYVNFYIGPNAKKHYNIENSFISELDNKERNLLEDELSFKFENFISFDEKIYSANNKLESIINSKKLFEAYPQFKDLNVKINISTNKKDYMYGANYYNENRLEIFADSNENAMRTLIHELQHCIQFEEGFHVGESYYKQEGLVNLFTKAIDKNKLFEKGSFTDLISKKTMVEIDDSNSYLNAEVVDNLYNNSNNHGLNDIRLITYKKIDDKYYINAMKKNATTFSDFIVLELKEDELSGFFNESIINKIKSSDGSSDIIEINNKIEQAKCFEVDTQIKINNAVYLDEIFVHEELYRRYPDIKDTVVIFDKKIKGALYTKELLEFNDKEENRAVIKLGRFNEDIKEILIHELQHYIQDFENWAKGGSVSLIQNRFNPKETKAELIKEKKEIIHNNPKLKELLNKFQINSISSFEKDQLNELKDITGFNKIQKQLISLEITGELPREEAYEQYKRLWGEQQARASQYRVSLDSTQREKLSWTQTLEKVEGEFLDSIINYDNVEASSEILETVLLDDNKKLNSKVLKEFADPLSKESKNLEEFKKTFTNNANSKNEIYIKSPIGKVKIDLKWHYIKLKSWKEYRGWFSGIINNLVKNPLFVVKEEDSSIKFFAPYKGKNGIRNIVSVSCKMKNGTYEMKTNYAASSKNRLLKLIKASDDKVLYVRSDIKSFYKKIQASNTLSQNEAKEIKKEIVQQNRINVELDMELYNQIQNNKESNLSMWFGDSKITDEEGNPKVVYHGTNYDKPIDEFRRDEKGLIFFSTDDKIAQRFAHDKAIYPVYLKAENIFDPRKKEHQDIVRKYLEENFENLKYKVGRFLDTHLQSEFSKEDYSNWTNLPMSEMFKQLEEEDVKDRYTAVEFTLNFFERKFDAAASTLNYDDNWIILEEKELGIIDLIKQKGFDSLKTYELTIDEDNFNIAVFNPGQIKSVNNKGTYNPHSTNIVEKNELGLDEVEKAISIIPEGMKKETYLKYLEFNCISKNELKASQYHMLLDCDVFPEIEFLTDEKINSEYLNNPGEIESREIEELYLQKLDTISMEEINILDDNYNGINM